MQTSMWSHGRQMAATLVSIALLFLGIFGIRETDRREIMTSLTKIEAAESALAANVLTLQALIPVSTAMGQTVSEIRARQQLNEHRIDALEQQLRNAK